MKKYKDIFDNLKQSNSQVQSAYNNLESEKKLLEQRFAEQIASLNSLVA